MLFVPALATVVGALGIFMGNLATLMRRAFWTVLEGEQDSSDLPKPA